MSLSLTQRDIEREVGLRSFERGLRYWLQGRVSGVYQCEEGHIHGKVRGTARQPYAQQIVLLPQKTSYKGGVQHVEIEGECTCPVGWNCKHVAAVLVSALEDGLKEMLPQRPDERSLSDLSPLTRPNPPEDRLMKAPAKYTVTTQSAPLPATPKPALSRELARWLDQAQETFADKPAGQLRLVRSGTARRIHYVLTIREFHGGNRLEISPKVMTPLKRGGYSSTTKELRLDYLDSQIAQEAITQEDTPLLGEIFIQSRGGYDFYGTYSLKPHQAPALLQRLLATERLFWQKPDGVPLQSGAEREVTPVWRPQGNGRQHLALWAGAESVTLLPTEPPWYVDAAGHLCGPIQTDQNLHRLEMLTRLPPVTDEEAPLLRPAMQRLLPNEPRWWPGASQKDLPQRTPVPALHLLEKNVRLRDRYGYVNSGYGLIPGETVRVPAALLTMDYDGVMVSVTDPREVLEIATPTGPELFLRDGAFESRALGRCKAWGFEPPTGEAKDNTGDELLFNTQMLSGLGTTLEPQARERLLNFLYAEVPRLRAEGWQVEVDENFPVALADTEDEFELSVEEGSGMDWFGLELGVTVDGERVSLLPLLLPQVARLAAAGDSGANGAEAQPTAPGVLFARLADGRALPVPVDRLGPLLGLLQEWYGPEHFSETEEGRLPGALAAGLVEVEEAARAAGLRWHGGQRLLEMGRRLRDFEKIQTVKPPRTFKGTLRGYQQEGLNWMQFLREYGFGGILADDMGLGKTVQTLAHLLVEKRSGRMDRPSLVIAPTSLMTNWRLEAARFAPSLKTLVLHGKERAHDFERIPSVDVVFTTYALVPRDEKTLLAQPWHLVILDEAHYIKNPSTKAALMVQRLNTRHRLCLTGTPMENHLGELWSLMHFLMPGLLGHKTRFGSHYKNPIEKQGNTQRQRELMQRVRPFVLRRLKSAVEKDLPPKTEIVEHVTLEGTQRDLYETLRLAMHSKVREEMAKKGLSRSHITILDALLKLRQVCCDPRLVKLDAAKKVKHSAKFERLFEMLPEMVEEGRRVLLFSQFTSMLALMEPELKKHGIGFLKLTGQTTKRAPLIEAFQNGEAPVFLLSLKAGGVGLNLTAADTVIHYDPWWNPAVENQATDRAHRLGQDKAVFVYKLITVGTVEEKIQQLQEKKQALVQSLLDPTAKSAAKITQQDVEWLFAPTAWAG